MYYRRFGETYRLHLQGSIRNGFLNAEEGIGRFSRTSVMKYLYSLRNDTEERSFHVLRGGIYGADGAPRIPNFCVCTTTNSLIIC